MLTFVMMVLAILYRVWYVLFHVHSHIDNVNFLVVHTPLHLRARILLGNSLYLKITAILFYYWDIIAVSECSFLWSGCTLSLSQYYFSKEQYSDTPEIAFIFI